MKRLLIVSDPPVAPGFLPRLRHLCDFLVQKGYDITLLTEESQTLSFPHTYPIVTIPMYSGTTLDWAIKTLWTLLTDWHNRAFANKSLKTKPVFDAVLCTAFSDFPLGAAQRIANSLNVPLICDIRDLDEQVDDSRYQYHHRAWYTMPFLHLYRAIHLRRRNVVLRSADAITTVSPWHAAFIRQFNNNVYVVYNGFDDKQFYPNNIPTEHFTITYIGSLFDWQKAGLDKVQQAIKDIGLPVHLELHTPQNNPIAYNQLGDAIRRSSIMLVLTSSFTHGMLTTKFYEALGCEKPVLCVPSDNGALAELIDYTHAGIATDDIETIQSFIREKYKEWQQNGFTRQHTQHRESFTREAQYDQFYRTYIQC